MKPLIVVTIALLVLGLGSGANLRYDYQDAMAEMAGDADIFLEEKAKKDAKNDLKVQYR